MKQYAHTPPHLADHCYDGPKAPLANSLAFTGTIYPDHDPQTARRARVVVWDHARGATAEEQQDDGLELLDALGLLGQPA